MLFENTLSLLKDRHEQKEGRDPCSAASHRHSHRPGLARYWIFLFRFLFPDWVQEFNAGHADKVAALYADEAVLMRKNGTVHNRESIQADLDRSINSARGHNYIVQSLRTEGSGKHWDL